MRSDRPTGRPREDSERRLTGTCGLLVAVLSLVMIPLYFIYSGPPPADNVLLRNLVTVLVLTFLAVFAIGLRRTLGHPVGLAADIAAGAGMTYAGMTFVAASLETGVALQYPDGTRDPTTDGPLAHGMVLLHGPVARCLIATFLLALAIAVIRSGVLPRWVATGSVILALINLAFLPSLFFGMDPSNFYAANGWGSTASIGGLNMLWIGAVGVAILRSSQQEVSR